VLLAARAPGTLGRASLPQLLLPPDSGNAPQTMFPVNVKDTRTFVASAAAPATELLSTVFAQPLSSHGSLYTRAECIGAGAYGAVHLGEAHGTHYPTRRLPQPAAASASLLASSTMRDEPRPAPAPAPATAPPEMPARVPRAVALKSSQQQPGKDGFPVTMTREVLVSRAIARSVPVLDVVTRVEQGGYGGYDVQRQRAAPGVTASHTVAASTAPPLTLRRSSAPAPVADKVLALTVWPTALAACALDPPALAQGDFAGFPRLLPPRLAAGAVVWLSFPRISHDLFGLTQAHRKGARLRVPPRHVKYMLYRLLQALEECEHAAVLHRDLKGSNVLVDERGRVLLADYGLARQHQDHLAALGYTNRVVTLWYRAPELLLGSSAYDSGVDVWSAGCVFAELLSGGRPLFQGHNNDVEQLRKIISVLGAPQKREDKPRKAPWTQVWNEFHTMCSLAGPMSKAKQTLTEIFKIVSAEEQQRAYEAEISASVPAAASVKAPENAATSPSRDSGSTQPPVSTDEHISPPINLNLDDEKAGTQVSTQEEPVDVVKPVLVTEDEMEILFSMLTMDPLKRPSARQLLNHHYFADDLIDEEVYMKEFFDIFSVGEFRERMFKARF
jgi:serine/threonine protein kinase